MSLPALRSLRQLLPDCEGYVLIDRFDDSAKVLPAEVFDMVVKSQGKLRYSTDGRLTRIRSIASLAMRLRKQRPYYAIYLMPSDRASAQIARDRAFFRLAGVSEFVGFQVADTVARNDAGPEKAFGESFLRFRRLWNIRAEELFDLFARTPLIQPTPAADEVVCQWMTTSRRFHERALVALCPLSNWPSKNLSITAAADLARRLENDLGVEVVVVGGTKDTASGAMIVDQARAGVNSCGTFSINETAALLHRCSVAISVDSGPMHLAAAVGTPTVVVYSRTNPNLYRWFPLGTDHTVLYRRVDCAGCGKSSCPIANHPCIQDVSIDEILAAAMRTLRRSPVLELH